MIQLALFLVLPKMSTTIKSAVITLLLSLLVLGLIFYYGFIFFPSSVGDVTILNMNSADDDSPTEIAHLLFGIVGSEKACHHRKEYMESWWRPNQMRGYLFLDTAPKGDLLPWSSASPPYRISDNLTEFVKETNAVAPIMIRMAHAIIEVVREYPERFRWLLMGDDDTIFFVENILDILVNYDYKEYYYFGGNGEFLLSNYWFSFNMGFGGAGYIFSYPVAKALARAMDSCLRRYAHLNSTDIILMDCLADFGVNLSPQKGMHQIDLRGNIAGFLSSHPKNLLMSLHQFDMVEPIFPAMDRVNSTRHLMKAAKLDQSRLLQQTICYHRHHSWSISVSWGYSVHIYEKIMPRSWLHLPAETFQPWAPPNPDPPHYMFNTRQLLMDDPCQSPHMFYFDTIENIEKSIVTSYSRSTARKLPPCLVDKNGNHSADSVMHIHVYSPATKRIEIDRSECCDIAYEEETQNATVIFRECMPDEIMA